MQLARIVRIVTLAGLVLGGTAALGAGVALAACSGLGQLTVTLTPGPVVPAYDPFAPGDVVRTMTLTVNNSVNALCDAAITFVRTPSIAQMSNGTAVLNYDITRVGGGSSLISSGYQGVNTPPAANRLDFIDIPRRGSASVDIEFRIPEGQLVPAGAYSDNLISIQAMRLRNGDFVPNLAGPTFAFSPQATVVSKCSLPPPSLSNLDLTTAISNGRPNEGVTRTTTFSNVQCTAPTKLRLTGAAMQPTSPTGPRAGFDNYINFRAVGSFGSASTTLTTTTTEQSAASAQKNVADGATTAGQIEVVVNLVNGQPILAGTYSGILTVSIDPTF